MFVIKKIARHRVFKNFSYLTIGSLVSQAVGVFTVIRITKLFAPEDYGDYTFLVSQGMLLFTIGDLGITNVVIRTIARDREKTKAVVLNGAIIRCAAVATLIFFYTGYNYLFGTLTGVQLVFVFLYALVTCFGHLFEIAFMGNEQMLPISLVNVAYSACWFLSVSLIPKGLFTVTFLFSAYLVLNVFKAAALYLALRTKNRASDSTGNFQNATRALLQQGWPYFVLMLLMLPATYLPNNFLQLQSSNEQIGYFNLSQRLTAPVELILGFVLSAVFPNLSALWGTDKTRFHQLIANGFQFFMLTGLLLCFLFTLFGREVVIFLFKAEYLPVAAVSELQIWYIFLMAVNSLTGTILSAVNKERLVLRSGIVSALIATPLLFMLSKYGAMGLSWGYVISFSLSMLYVWYLFANALGEKISNSAMLWVVAIVLFVLSYFVIQHLSLLYKVIIALLVTGISAMYFFKAGKVYFR